MLQLLSFKFDLKLLVKPETLFPALNSMSSLLGCFFIATEIKNQKGMCHALHFGGRRAMCQDRMVGRKATAIQAVVQFESSQLSQWRHRNLLR